MTEEPNEPIKIEPDTFAISIGSYTRQTWKLLWEKTHLTYAVYGEDYETQAEAKLNPTPEAWSQLWAVLDEIEAWEWDAYYFASAEEGKGTLWTIEILMKDGRHLDSGGSNSFPGLAEALARTAAGSRGTRRRGRRGGRGPAPAEPEAVVEGAEPDGEETPFETFLEALRALIGGREFFPFDPAEIQQELSREEVDRLVPPPEPPPSRRRSGSSRGAGERSDGEESRSRRGRTSRRGRRRSGSDKESNSLSRVRRGRGARGGDGDREKAGAGASGRDARGASSRSDSPREGASEGSGRSTGRRRGRRGGRRRSGEGSPAERSGGGSGSRPRESAGSGGGEAGGGPRRRRRGRRGGRRGGESGGGAASGSS